MSKELVIKTTPEEVVIALLENRSLVELHKEKPNSDFAVGDLYLGRIKKLVPGLNAAFVNVGYEKDAFLHYFDLGPQASSLLKFIKQSLSGKRHNGKLDKFELAPDIDKGGKINQVLSTNKRILVQIAKEPISTKGPRISCELSLAGRFLVLVPFSERVSVSQKIGSSEERDRLKRLIMSIKPKNFGVIIRTVAENKRVAELNQDLTDLVQKWERTFKGIRRGKAPAKVLGELNRTSAILRDLLNAEFSSIYVDDSTVFEEVKSYLRTIAPEKEKIAKLYRGKGDILEHSGIHKQIKALFGKHVTMKSGAYLVVEHTEALHVIDVNSGNTAKSEDDQESNALRVNLEAAEEIARQLRLRDMGGIIVVDFIDMQKSEHRKQLHQKINEMMKPDRAKHHVLPPSKFGLVQITRQRVRPEMEINTAEKCPSCKGTGEVKASILLLDEIENNLRYLMDKDKEQSLTLCVHPFIEAYLKRGAVSMVMRWMWKYKKRIKVRPVSEAGFLEYHFLNGEGEEIKA
ncbi:MAG: Rne/Rng family ribonuclease [Bacteroidota bacterium]